MITKTLNVPVDEELYQKIKDIARKEQRSTGIVIYKLLKLGVDQCAANGGKQLKLLFSS